MNLEWTRRATADLARVERFLARHSDVAAARLAVRLYSASERLRDFPRVGSPLPYFAPREVRRLIVDRYELRYDIVGSTVRVLRVWHEREHRLAMDE